MTAEQLEELAGGANPAFMDLGLDYEEIITHLASRVITAEKLAEALDHAELQSVHYGYDNGAGGGNFMYKDSIFVDDFKSALTAYREASK